MSQVVYFDSNCAFGPPAGRLPGAPADRRELLAELDHCRISRALVYHIQAREMDPRAANACLLREIEAEPRFVPCAVLSHAPYIPDRDLAAECRDWLERGVRAFRMFPHWHGVDFSLPLVRAVLELLQERRVPLWLDFDQIWYNYRQAGTHEQRQIDWSGLKQLARDYPGLPLVLVGGNYTHLTRLYPLLDQCPNLLLETSLLQAFEAFPFICGHWGAGRLLFGTGLGAVSPGAARAMLAYAEISDDDRGRIAAENLEALLGLGPTPALPEDPDRPEILRLVDEGRPLTGIPFYDAHGHIAPPGVDGMMGLSLGPQDAASIARVSGRLGVRATVISSWSLLSGDAPAGNEVASQAAQDYPGRFLPLAVYNPNYPEHWESTAALFTGERRFFGFKPYPFTQRTALSDRSFRPMLELADRLHLPVLCHFDFEPLGGVPASEIEILAPRHPNAQFLMAHAGASPRVAAQCIEMARRFHNVWLEINYTSVPYGMVGHLVRNAGAERVLFGTDIPMRNPAPILGWVVYDRNLTGEEMRLVLGGNFIRLAAGCGWSL
ncbi:amidohydrolase family protein [bacterium]|nr:amidohydrolase family protein [bacterium]